MKNDVQGTRRYPISLDLDGKSVVVIGGGKVAERKVRGLIEAGARVTVIAPQIAAGLAALAPSGSVVIVERKFSAGDLDGAILAFATTGDDDVNAAVVAEARGRGIRVNDASDGERGDFSTPATHRTGSLTFSVETQGTAPAFAVRLRDELSEHFDERYARAAAALAAARRYAAIAPPQSRAAILAALSARPIDELAAMNVRDIEREVDHLLAGDAASEAEPFLRLVCATRSSALALHQARIAIARLATAGMASTILHVSTRADRDGERPLSALGGDNVFVKELELALREKRADYAVHSCKDLPSALEPDMRIAAIGPREDPRDVFCSERYRSLEALPPGALVGTSSPRRCALLATERPDLSYVTIRGNVDTRLRKLRDGAYDAIVLAAAGLARLGLRATHMSLLDPSKIVPAVGQGALAIEVRAADATLAERIHSAFADRPSEIAVLAERAFLRTLRAGCSAPVGALAEFDGSTLRLRAAIASLDGRTVVRGEAADDVADDAWAEVLGVALAQRLLAEGGAALLADAGRGTENVESAS
jgi:hydroxymethylbilane synthase